jgi:hypothetical protein
MTHKSSAYVKGAGQTSRAQLLPSLRDLGVFTTPPGIPASGAPTTRAARLHPGLLSRRAYGTCAVCRFQLAPPLALSPNQRFQNISLSTPSRTFAHCQLFVGN